MFKSCVRSLPIIGIAGNNLNVSLITLVKYFVCSKSSYWIGANFGDALSSIPDNSSYTLS